MKNLNVHEGDVLLLLDGRILRVMCLRSNSLNDSDLSIVQFLDRNEESYISLNTLHIEHNLGQNCHILAYFYMSRSIHLRLNKMIW